MNTTLVVAPTQWFKMKDMDEVEPINRKDYECLAEIREVLKRYGKQDRFGVALLHKHFDLAEDEILVEYTGKEDRVLTIKPVKVGVAGNTVGTIYQLLDGEVEAMMYCHQFCSPDINGRHRKTHTRT